jgi:hypothetical protein
MAGFMTSNTANFIRGTLYSRQIKTLLLDDLNAMNWVRVISDFPDGQTFQIPSLGEATTFDIVEGQAIKYESLDTGAFTFQFDNYKGSAHAISEKFKRDSYWASDVIAAFVPREHRALMEAVETNIFSKMNSGQTASNANIINNASHRWVAQGTNQIITPADFSSAKINLMKANVPLNDLIMICDPTVAYQLETQANLANLLSPNPMWQKLAYDGSIKGFKFQFNVYGFDVYVSNYLPAIASETIGSRSVTNGVANFFFSASPGDTTPVIGGFRQNPTVYSEFNKDLQQEEYLTVCEYGFKLYRPENLVTILTSASAGLQP